MGQVSDASATSARFPTALILRGLKLRYQGYEAYIGEGCDAALIALMHPVWRPSENRAYWLSIIEAQPKAHWPLCCSYSRNRSVLAYARSDRIVEQ